MQNRNQNLIHIIDMHAHLLCLSEEYRERLTEQEMLALGTREFAVRRKCGIDTVFSCGTPQEWELMRQCLARSETAIQLARQDSSVLHSWRMPDGFRMAGRDGENYVDASGQTNSDSAALSFGIHPWHSDRFDPRDCRELFMDSPIIGEIGMDSVWCEVPLAVQRRTFARQLEIAAELKKPVVLHTKGQERQIAEMIREFPGKACVHWYSGGEEDFETFLEAGCYFTLGPDLAEQFTSLYQRMLREIPAERLFLETDGLSSLAWMRGQEIGAVSFGDIQGVLERNLEFAAGEKQMQTGQLRTQMRENFQRFTS